MSEEFDAEKLAEKHNAEGVSDLQHYIICCSELRKQVAKLQAELAAKAEAGEFTKKMREQFKAIDVRLGINIEDAQRIIDLINKIPEVCTVIDQQAAELKSQAEEIKRLQEAVAIAKNYISEEGDCVEQAVHKEIDQALKGNATDGEVKDNG